ncbi:unnamed protein product [Paramecium pentaurelia]|uniref:CBM20 domain-containing protein n=1 Tax=Paramecium pentaurelia TaxID=43138 RepID=A0A8S1V5G9_9CILI|nr:unnamed protein product [Paramecium pentaurelia]
MNTQVFFRIYCKTQFSQHVKVVGNEPQLGNWNPSKGLQLLTNESMYPIWFTDYPLELLAYSKLEFKVVIIDDQNCYWECCPNREMNVQSLKQIVIVNYDNPSIQVLGIKSLVSEVELPNIEQNRARKVSIQVQDYMSYTDSDSEDQNSKKSQLTNDNSLFPSIESFNSCLLPNEDLQQDRIDMD